MHARLHGWGPLVPGSQLGPWPWALALGALIITLERHQHARWTAVGRRCEACVVQARAAQAARAAARMVTLTP